MVKIISQATLIIVSIILTAFVIILGWTTGNYDDVSFWQGVLVELHGVLIEFLLIIILYGLYKKYKAIEIKENNLNRAYRDLFKSTIFSIDMISEKNSWRTIYSKEHQSKYFFGKYFLYLESFHDMKINYYFDELEALQSENFTINNAHINVSYPLAADRFIDTYETYKQLISDEFDENLESDLNIAYKECKKFKKALEKNEVRDISKGYVVIFKLHEVMLNIVINLSNIEPDTEALNERSKIKLALPKI